MLRASWFIARKDLAAMLRARETLLWVFLMPLIFFYFIGTVTGGFGVPGSGDEPDPIQLCGAPRDDLIADELVHRLERENYRVVRELEGGERISPRLVFPAPEGGAGFGAGVLTGKQATLTLQHDEADLRTQFDRMRVGKAVYGVLADLAVFAQRGEPPTSAGFRGLEAAPRSIAVEVRPAGKRRQ